MNVKQVDMFFARIAFLLLIGLSVKGQSPTVPSFVFLKADQSGIFTNKNVPGNKKSLFVFFDITCPHCQEAIRSFNKNYKQLSNVSVYLITKDDKTAAMNFLSQYAKDLYQRKNVTMLLDSYNEFIKEFKPVKYPSMFLYSDRKRLLKYSDESKDVSEILNLIKKNDSLVHKQS